MRIAVLTMVASLCGIYSLLVRFSNPGLTETQVFMHDWKLYLALIILAYCFLFADGISRRAK